MKDIYIGIDPSLKNTGICVIEYDDDGNNFTCLLHDTIQNRKRELNPKTGKERWVDMTHPESMTNIYRQIRQVVHYYHILKSHNPKNIIICIETPFIHRQNVKGGMMQMAAYGVCMTAADVYGDQVILTDPMTIKKSFTGKGNADKDMMMEEFVRRDITSLNGEDVTEHVVDAIACAEYAYKTHNGKTD